MEIDFVGQRLFFMLLNIRRKGFQSGCARNAVCVNRISMVRIWMVLTVLRSQCSEVVVDMQIRQRIDRGLAEPIPGRAAVQLKNGKIVRRGVGGDLVHLVDRSPVALFRLRHRGAQIFIVNIKQIETKHMHPHSRELRLS